MDDSAAEMIFGLREITVGKGVRPSYLTSKTRSQRRCLLEGDEEWEWARRAKGRRLR